MNGGLIFGSGKSWLRRQPLDFVECLGGETGVNRFFTWVNKDDKSNKDKEGGLYRAVLETDREGRRRVLVVWRDMTFSSPFELKGEYVAWQRCPSIRPGK